MSRTFAANIANFLSAAHISAYNITADITIAFWCKRSAVGADAGVFQSTYGASSDIDWTFITANTMQLYGEATVAQNVVSTGVVSDTTAWHHVAFTKSGTTWTYYFDGVAGGTGTYSSSAFTTHNNTFHVGRSFWNPFAGQMALFSVHNTAWTAAQVLIAKTVTNPESIGTGCVGSWHLNNADLADYSGNNNPLVVTGTVASSTDDPPVLAPKVTVLTQAVAQAANW